jgi:DNA-binding response OmpR family regulator
MPTEVAILVRASGSDEPGQFALAASEVLIGRAPDSTLVINDPLVSRRHARIRSGPAVGYRYILEDLGSRNGTYLNGRRLAEARVLEQGDELRIGSTAFTFVDPNATLQGFGAARFFIDQEAREVWVRGQRLPLSPREYALLALLFRHLDRVVSREEIGREVWPEEPDAVAPASVDSLARRVREKLAAGGADSATITGQDGQGYVLSVT